MDSASAQSSFSSFPSLWLGGAILSGLILYYRPRPRLALALMLLLHGIAFLWWYGSLPRAYALGVSSDRSLGLGLALHTADGGSAFDHVQVQFGNLEPFWTFVIAILSGFSSDRVPFVYDHMGLFVMALTALGFYWTWSRASEGEDSALAEWRGVLVAGSVLGLSSFAFSPDPPMQHFWQGNFVFKPNHAMAFGLVGLLSRWRVGDASWVRLGILQGILIWAFILDWAYWLPALLLAALLARRGWQTLKTPVLGTVFGLLLGLPYLLHLLRDYNPVSKGEMPQIWRDQMGERLTNPYWWSLDLGPLLILFLVGLVISLTERKDPGGTAFLLTGPIVALAYVIGLRFGFAPEPDEGYYYWRLVAAAGAGLALWRMFRSRLKKAWGPAVAFALVLAVSFPARFDAERDDRFYPLSRQPVIEPLQTLATWIRGNTPKDAVFVASDGIFLSGLTGRQFLMVRPRQTPDRANREKAEQDIVTSSDASTVRRAARQYGVTHVLVDDGMRERYGNAARGLGNRPWFEPQFTNSFASVLRIRLDP